MKRGYTGSPLPYHRSVAYSSALYARPAARPLYPPQATPISRQTRVTIRPPVFGHHVRYHAPRGTYPTAAESIRHAPLRTSQLLPHAPYGPPRVPYSPPHADTQALEDELMSGNVLPAKRPRYPPDAAPGAAINQSILKALESPEFQALPAQILEYFKQFVLEGLLQPPLHYFPGMCQKIPEERLEKCLAAVREYGASGHADAVGGLLSIVLSIEESLAKFRAKTGKIHWPPLSPSAQQSLHAIQASFAMPPLLYKLVSDALSCLGEQDIPDLMEALESMERRQKDQDVRCLLGAIQNKLKFQFKEHMARPLSDEEDACLERLLQMGALPEDKILPIRASLSEIHPIAGLRLLGLIQAKYPLDNTLTFMLSRIDKTKKQEFKLFEVCTHYNRAGLTPEEDTLVANLVAEGYLPERWVTSFRTRLYGASAEAALRVLREWRPVQVDDYGEYMLELKNKLEGEPPVRTPQPYRELSEEENMLITHLELNGAIPEGKRIEVEYMAASVPASMALDTLNYCKDHSCSGKHKQRRTMAKMIRMMDGFEWLPAAEKQKLLVS